ncbi:hypothetical protein E3U43_018098 [Larimichthys crocea]|uniref:Uncharacterized protein n=1 Tax=Larimichthys crocea TaxID=215358 RepID=A0ACD3R0Z6_LARCR|nr:hypothetical protein E3U43_018098 [Larimichthys crocea]
MKTVVALLLLCLCDRGQSDCQADCLSCSNILPKQLSFNTMVCLTECEGNVSPAFYRDFCRKVLLSPLSSLSGTVRKRSQEEVEALFPEEEQVEGGLLLPIALQRFDHMTRALGVDERDLGGKGSQLDTTYNSQDAMSLEDEYEDEAGQEEGAAAAAEVASRGQGDCRAECLQEVWRFRQREAWLQEADVSRKILPEEVWWLHRHSKVSTQVEQPKTFQRVPEAVPGDEHSGH